MGSVCADLSAECGIEKLLERFLMEIESDFQGCPGSSAHTQAPRF